MKITFSVENTLNFFFFLAADLSGEAVSGESLDKTSHCHNNKCQLLCDSRVNHLPELVHPLKTSSSFVCMMMCDHGKLTVT